MFFSFQKISMIALFCNLFLCIKLNAQIRNDETKSGSYYFSNSGNDNNDGTVNHPFETINKQIVDTSFQGGYKQVNNSSRPNEFSCR